MGEAGIMVDDRDRTPYQQTESTRNRGCADNRTVAIGAATMVMAALGAVLGKFILERHKAPCIALIALLIFYTLSSTPLRNYVSLWRPYAFLAHRIAAVKAFRYDLLRVRDLTSPRIWSSSGDVAKIGPLDASLFANFAPVVTILITAWQGHRLLPVETAGAALVIGALVANNLVNRRLMYRAERLRMAPAASIDKRIPGD